MAKNENVVTVLAFEKKLVPSDGLMYETTWEKRHQDDFPLKLMEKSVRGTVSHRLKKTTDKDIMKLNMDIASPNPQTVDHCALSENRDTLKLKFTLKVLSNIEKPSACNHAEFQKSYTNAAKKYIENEQFLELAKRYATNLVNARFLWRNRVGAENIEVIIKVLNQNLDSWKFNAKEFSLSDFDKNHNQIDSLVRKIAEALSGKVPFLLLDITTCAQIGRAQEVYPSEEMILNKGSSKSTKSKVLYQINDVAAMHSQKIGNAIRTIDTWYPEYNTVQTGPIAIEAYGSVTTLGVAYRNPKNKSDFYTLFDKFAWGEPLASKEEEHYVMAMLVRGGVFGESGKD